MLTAFLDKNLMPEELTWQEVENRSGFSKGTFWNYFIELFEEGEIKGVVRVVNHKLVNIYFLGHPETAGVYGYKEEDPRGGSFRFYLQKGTHAPVAIQEGVMRSMKKTKNPLAEKGESTKDTLVFCGTQPPKLIEKPKENLTVQSSPFLHGNKKIQDIDILEDLKKMKRDLEKAKRNR